jgi:hypothetical protein
VVTGGAGFLGTYVVRSFDLAQERERGAAEITEVIPSAGSGQALRLAQDRLLVIVSEPPPMLRTIARDLSQHGIRADAIRTDAWE